MAVVARVRARRAARSALVVLCSALVASVAFAGGGASASSAPLLSQTMLARSYGTGAITETFTDPAGTSLATTTDTCPSPWTVTGGAMTITTGGRLVSSTSALVSATVPLCGSTSIEAEASAEVHRSGSSAAGVLVNAHPSGRPATAVVYYSEPTFGTLRLQRISATGTVTTWAEVNGIGSNTTGRHLGLMYRGGVYTVSLNGSVLLSYPVPDAATRTAVEAHRAVGIVAVSDVKSTFDNFQAFPR